MGTAEYFWYYAVKEIKAGKQGNMIHLGKSSPFMAI